MEFRMRHVCGHVAGAGRMAHQEDMIWIAAITCDLVIDEPHGRAHVLNAGWQGKLWREAVLHIAAGHAVTRRNHHDVVVEGAAGWPLVAARIATAVHEHQHRAFRGAALGSKNVDDIARVRAILHVARDLDARIRLLLLQGHVDFAGVLTIAHAADRAAPCPGYRFRYRAGVCGSSRRRAPGRARWSVGRGSAWACPWARIMRSSPVPRTPAARLPAKSGRRAKPDCVRATRSRGP